MRHYPHAHFEPELREEVFEEKLPLRTRFLAWIAMSALGWTVIFSAVSLVW